MVSVGDEILILYGPPAQGVLILVNHFPQLSEMTLYVSFPQVGSIIMVRFGSDQPQIGTLSNCCKTAPFEKMEGNFKYAWAVP